MQFQTILTNAAPRMVNKKDGSGQFPLYEIFDQTGQAWVVKQDVFNLAQRFVGQMVEIVGRVEQNGQWTNYFADYVGLPGAGGAVTAQTPQNPVQMAQQAQAQYQPQTMVPQQSTTAPIPPPQPAPPLPQPVFPTEKDRSINRQTAGKVAALISGDDPSAFWHNVQDLARFFESGSIPPQYLQQMAQVGGYVGDEDIPF